MFLNHLSSSPPVVVTIPPVSFTQPEIHQVRTLMKREENGAKGRMEEREEFCSGKKRQENVIMAWVMGPVIGAN